MKRIILTLYVIIDRRVRARKRKRRREKDGYENVGTEN